MQVQRDDVQTALLREILAELKQLNQLNTAALAGEKEEPPVEDGGPVNTTPASGDADQ